MYTRIGMDTRIHDYKYCYYMDFLCTRFYIQFIVRDIMRFIMKSHMKSRKPKTNILKQICKPSNFQAHGFNGSLSVNFSVNIM